METDPLLTIVAVSFNHSIHQLRVFLSSLLCQTDDRWRCIILHDGGLPEGPYGFTECWSDILYTGNELWGIESKIEFHCTSKRFADYGHSLRETGLIGVKSKYINFQNGDNYLMPKFVEIMLNLAESNQAALVICNQIHNYACTLWGGPEYGLLDSELKANHIDMANFIIKTDLAQEVGFQSKAFAADWDFLAACIKHKPNMRVVKTPSVLSVHN